MNIRRLSVVVKEAGNINKVTLFSMDYRLIFINFELTLQCLHNSLYFAEHILTDLQL